MLERLPIVRTYRHIELWLASVTVLWGGWLLGGWDTFGTTPAFRVVTNIAPEWAWGTVLVAAGALLFWGAYCVHASVRKWALMLLALMWLAVWVGLTLGNWRGTSTVVYIHIAILSGLLYLRTEKNGAKQ